MRLSWTDSASKHGVDRRDALNAMLNYYVHVPVFDEPRAGRATRPDLWIGPQRTLGAPLLEVMTEASASGLTVFHVMVARPKFLALLEEGE